MSTNPASKLTALLITAAATLTLALNATAADAAPVKLIPTTRYGSQVDKTTGGNVCQIGGPDECQLAKEEPGRPPSPEPRPGSEEPGGFEYPGGVAVAPTGDVYVSDSGNHRVQELTATGEFILMFGKEVNATTHGDVCTAEEIKNDGVKCKEGVKGGNFDALAYPKSIAIDQSTGNVYVQDSENRRVDEYTADGQFVLTVGKDVNQTKAIEGGASEAETNLCTAGEICQRGVESTPESTEKGAFDMEEDGDLLTVGDTPEHLLYVGDAHRIQEFTATGEWKGEMRLPAAVIAASSAASSGSGVRAGITALAVDAGSQTAYVDYNHEGTVRRFDLSTGAEIGSPMLVAPRQNTSNIVIEVYGLALNPSGQLAVASLEHGVGINALEEPFGLLFDGGTGETISTFGPSSNEGELSSLTPVAFGPEGALYMAITRRNELQRFAPVDIAEVKTEAAQCKEGAERGSSVAFECALNGKVNPYDVSGTKVFFEWGRSAKGEACAAPESTTEEQAVPTEEALRPVAAQLGALRPNQTFCFALVGVDENVKLPEDVAGKAVSFATPVVAPRVVGAPSVEFVSAGSAVMQGEVNPENASTEYFFEYAPESAPGESALQECVAPLSARGGTCPGVAITPVAQAGTYGPDGVVLEARGLQQARTYRYRLAAVNEAGEDARNATGGAVIPEGTFTTASTPTPSAQGGTASAVGTTTATISGTVEPDGEAASYSFELGLYEGSSTHYVVVSSGSVVASSTPMSSSLGLTGLQPGSTYAFRIAVHSGYIANATATLKSAPVLFTTAGLPAVLESPGSLPLLAVPNIAFPAATPVPPKTTTAPPKKKAKKTKAKKRKKRKAKAKKSAARKVGRSSR